MWVYTYTTDLLPVMSHVDSETLRAKRLLVLDALWYKDMTTARGAEFIP